MHNVYRRFLGALVVLGLLWTSCSKEASFDPDISKIDSSAVAQVEFKESADRVIAATQVGAFVLNSAADSSYISFPISVTKAGAYNMDVVAYFGADSVIFKREGFVAATDSVLKLYPTDNTFGGLAAGTYRADSSHININDTATGYLLDASIVVSDETVPVPPIDINADSSWSMVFDGKEMAGKFGRMTTLDGVAALSGGTLDGGYDLYLNFKLPTESITAPTILTSIDNTSMVGLEFDSRNDQTLKYSTNGKSANFSVTVNKYDATTGDVEGSFEGALVTSSEGTDTYKVEKGTFKGTITGAVNTTSPSSNGGMSFNNSNRRF